MSDAPLRTPRERQQAARAFADRWAGRGYEKGETASFWIELLRDVIGMPGTTTNILFEGKTAKGGYIDASIPDAKTLIEQKSLGVSLDKPELRQHVMVTPYEQAKQYADTLPYSQRPRWIVVCNFGTFRIHDLEEYRPERDFVEFALDELPDQLHLLDFLMDPSATRLQREEKASMDAGVLIGRLYDLLRAQYLEPDTEESQHSLNVLCVRLVFCLFAEDAGLFPKDAFYRYLTGFQPGQVRRALKELFTWLDTPPAERDPYAEDDLSVFPYVNGGLFAPGADGRQPEIPQFTEEIVHVLLEDVSHGTDWSAISPTIFGGVFESTLNPETRHAGGMHYTSPRNIHRVIDPLFLDGLTAELDGILRDASLGDRARRTRLRTFHEKLGSLTFFDPACGSGNFLTETYLSLRRLENKVISELDVFQQSFGFEDSASPLKITLDQFHGIEINDFAVSVATTALWIAQLQANAETQAIVTQVIEDLPLRDAAHIVHGNALTTAWEDVLPPARCSYVIGNPPFLGARNQTAEQKAELVAVFEGSRNAGSIDYVGGWYMKAARYIGDHPVRCAFVSTNSVCQGEQVANLWSPIYDLGVRIDFAHDTFKWTNDAATQAAVFCVIVGFSKLGGPTRLYHYPTATAEPALERPAHLNAYLKDAPDAFVWSRSRPLSNVPRIGIGNKPIDGGHYLFTPTEKAEFLAAEPGAAPYFKRWYGSREFIQGIERWVLDLAPANPADLQRLPLVLERIRAVQVFRAASKSAPTRKLAETPMKFHVENRPPGPSILIGRHSSERRKYLPLGYVSAEALCGDSAMMIADASPYHFGVLHSRMHNAWMRTVAGRLKSDYRYSGGVVYNTFVWPDTTPEQEAEIARLAQAVLDARAQYPDATIAQLYDPDVGFLYPALTAAHTALDAAVERAYGLEAGLEEKDIAAHLFELYAAAVR